MKELLPKLNTTNKEKRVIPAHIAIIMDGNRRWAKNKNLPSMFGHKEGVQALKKITRYANDVLGIKYLTVYAFSTENWNRKKDEVDFLIRTGGEMRISNYLLWQCAYTEFYSTDVLWPAFDSNELEKAIEEFNKRQRRFGV